MSDDGRNTSVRAINNATPDQPLSSSEPTTEDDIGKLIKLSKTKPYVPLMCHLSHKGVHG